MSEVQHPRLHPDRQYLVTHPGLAGGGMLVRGGALQELLDHGLLAWGEEGGFHLTPQGYLVYDQLKQAE